MIFDADTYYVHQAFLYIGKTDPVGEGLGDHVVVKLMNSDFDRGLYAICDKRQFFNKPFYCQEAQKTK